MRLATRRDGTRDGELRVVSRDGRSTASARGVVPTLQAALDDWDAVRPALERIEHGLSSGAIPGEPVATTVFGAPLPRAYEWVDGSAFLNHVRLVRKARGAEPPASLEHDPMVYQGGSGALLGPTDDVPLLDEAYGLDFESEVAVVLGDTPQGTSAELAPRYVRLVMLANDWTYRELVPSELAKGFGFFQSKPATSFSTFAVTPDELGSAFRAGRVHRPLLTHVNDTLVGDPDAGEMHFSFYDLIAHITRTRAFAAGTILGSGTVSNADEARGVSCLAERRMREIIAHGQPTTPFLRASDVVRLHMTDEHGRDIFGALKQRVVTA